jgi:hypothetical protein
MKTVFAETGYWIALIRSTPKPSMEPLPMTNILNKLALSLYFAKTIKPIRTEALCHS